MVLINAKKRSNNFILRISRHLSSNPQYTKNVESMLRGVMSSAKNDMDLILVINAIQYWAKE